MESGETSSGESQGRYSIPAAPPYDQFRTNYAPEQHFGYNRSRRSPHSYSSSYTPRPPYLIRVQQPVYRAAA